MGLEQILNHCGYNSAFDLIKDNTTYDDLMDLLAELLSEKDDIVYELAEEIASSKFEWVDWEQVKADAEDRAYEEYRDREYDRD